MSFKETVKELENDDLEAMHESACNEWRNAMSQVKSLKENLRQVEVKCSLKHAVVKVYQEELVARGLLIITD